MSKNSLSIPTREKVKNGDINGGAPNELSFRGPNSLTPPREF